ncbi:MAG: DsrE family protein [Gammaproteobacteria bacterium]
MKRLMLPLGLLALLLTAGFTIQGIVAEEKSGDSAYEPQKVVYHVNFDGGQNMKQYKSTLGNILNHVNAVGQNKLDLRVVMNGDGLGLLMEAEKDADMAQRISNLKAQGVKFQICKNTLTGRNIQLEDLYDAWDEDVVPSGVAEVAKLEQNGFALIKTY